ncbi:unnamed protein product [Polarella glacialis]|uniref:CSD domain-containing protein n=1 Tax=Polarella glacialis TaxID=89957 RepID=A0A813J8D9_POLGL|nr:unnamed protein product [Polarella glacialis]
MPPPPPPAVMPTSDLGSRFVGTIMHFNAEKNFGFISSPSATDMFGKDVFISVAETWFCLG